MTESKEKGEVVLELPGADEIIKRLNKLVKAKDTMSYEDYDGDLYEIYSIAKGYMMALERHIEDLERLKDGLSDEFGSSFDRAIEVRKREKQKLIGANLIEEKE